MIIAVVSDIHDHHDILDKVLNHISAYNKPDIWIYSGDIGTSINMFHRVINKYKGIHIVIYGNHDSRAIRYIDRRPRIWLLKFGERVKIRHIWFLGIPGNLGSGSQWYHWKEYELRELIRKFKTKRIDIIVSHECPLGVADINNEKHLGKKILRELIIELSPRLFICGHIHAGIQVGRIENTVVVNAGAISYLDLSPPEYVIISINETISVKGHIFESKNYKKI